MLKFRIMFTCRMGPGATHSNKRIEAFWPNNTALVESRYKIREQAIGTSQVTGVLLLDVPLTTRHVTKVDYGYDVRCILSWNAYDLFRKVFTKQKAPTYFLLYASVSLYDK